MNNRILLPAMLVIFVILILVCYYIVKTDNDIVKSILYVGNNKIQLPQEAPETEQPKEKFKYDISHLTQSSQITWGPIQDDEALLLFGLVKALRPKTVLECGMGRGASSLNFLKALDQDAKIYCYDIEILNKNAKSFDDPRFKFIQKSQTEFNPDDFDNRIIDLAYLDNGHYYDKEIALFPKLIKQMSPNGVIVVHDTGLHVDDIVRGPCVCEYPKLCGVMHCPPERQFINWIGDNYPEWQIINIHSFIQYRHGLTILQRKHKLNLDEVDKKNCRFDTKNSQPVL